MSYLNRSSGRPRDAAREAEILSVAYEVLVERGYEGITFEEVARRARASKPTLYRRWTSKRELVVAALRAGPASREGADVVDTGSLRGDLLALTRRLLVTMSATDGYSALALLQAGFEDRALGDAIEQSMGPTGGRLPASVVEAAVRRGELPDGVDPFPYEEVAGSVLLMRRLCGLDTGDDYLAALIDTVLIPALRATATAEPRPLPAGIFSNRATATVADPPADRPARPDNEGSTTA
ncbi:TetR/AcrR family transcriptional regulator [Leifsonia sp. NPDC080035]|uniref:TetR/AcrR family transcriptional regulator n=1 Tax=Leifsonia sp. NPDC080035 TaxID=3143936 RepID=A0AAU7GFD8_9MICO